MPNEQTERFSSAVRTITDVRADRYSVRQFGLKLKAFFIDVWLDIVVLVVLGVTAAGIFVAPHTFNRLFPVTFYNTSNDIVWTQFAYPYIAPPLGTAAVGIVCAAVPIAVILIAQLFLHSFIDAAYSLLGLFYALISGCLFQVILKKTIGGLRPHFLSVCEPLLPLNGTVGVGFQNVMFTVDQVCRGDRKKITNAVESFPSGHAQIAFAGLVYLAIYLFAHLRIQAQRRPSYWRMALVVAPVLLATYIAATLVLTYNHHGHDVLAGGLIGSSVALFAYRMVFVSIWDAKWNTIVRSRFGREGDEMLSSEVDPRKPHQAAVVNEGPVLPR